MSNDTDTEDVMTAAAVRDWIMAEGIAPLDGEPLTERFKDDMGAGYNAAGMATAKALLIVCEADPTLLDVPEGANAAFHDAHWKAACARWPGLNDWLGGITGFMFGWANAKVRYAMSAPQVGNPALVAIVERRR